MTVDDLKKYFAGIVEAAKLEVTDKDGLVGSAVNMGMAEFWTCRNWSFRTKLYPLDVSAAADSYDLPDDFDKVRIVTERATTTGRQLRYLSPEEFDYTVPRLDIASDGYPAVFTIFRDLTDGKIKMKCFPRPVAQTLYVLYLTKNPQSPDLVPDEALGALRAVIEKYLYPTFTEKFQAALLSARGEVAEAERLDSPNAAQLFRIFDDTDYPTTTGTEFMSVNSAS